MNHCKTETLSSRLPRHSQCGSVWIPALLMLLALTASAAAVWQWQRSQYHAALSQQVQAPQRVTGVWLPDSTVYIAPRMMDARMGAWAVSVLQTADTKGLSSYIAVQRGWAQQIRPDAPPYLAPLSTQTVTLQGNWVNALPNAYALGQQTHAALGVWQNYDAKAHAQLLNIALAPQILVLSADSPDAERGVLRRSSAQKELNFFAEKADKNRGYAAQWLGLAIVGVGGLAWMWRGRKRKTERKLESN